MDGPDQDGNRAWRSACTPDLNPSSFVIRWAIGDMMATTTAARSNVPGANSCRAQEHRGTRTGAYHLASRRRPAPSSESVEEE